MLDRAGSFAAGLLALVCAAPDVPADDVVCRGCVGSRDLSRNAISGAHLKKNSVGRSELRRNSVTTRSIRDGTITTSKIRNGAVGTSKIRQRAVTSDKLADGAVSETDIASGAVSDSKIQDGAVSSSKIARGAVTAAKLGLARTIFIEDSGDSFLNCLRIVDAVFEAQAPATIVLGPGTYDCQDEQITLSGRWSLIGSGEGITTIRGSMGGSNGVIRMGSNATLRDVTVVNDGNVEVSSVVGLYVGQGVSTATNWTIRDVTVEARNGTLLNVAVRVRGDCDGGVMSNVRTIATASVGDSADAIGLFFTCDTGTVYVSDLFAVADDNDPSLPRSWGVYKDNDATLIIRNSSLEGDYSIQGFVANISSEIPRLISTEVRGDRFGYVRCVGVYTASGFALTDGTTLSGGC